MTETTTCIQLCITN